jgi:TetR/AcrR family transcriptional regulator
MDLKYGVYMVMAPMLFLAMWKHSLGSCCDPMAQLVPEHYLATQLDMLLYGFGTGSICPSPVPEQPIS